MKKKHFFNKKKLIFKQNKSKYNVNLTKIKQKTYSINFKSQIKKKIIHPNIKTTRIKQLYKTILTLRVSKHSKLSKKSKPKMRQILIQTNKFNISKILFIHQIQTDIFMFKIIPISTKWIIKTNFIYKINNTICSNNSITYNNKNNTNSTKCNNSNFNISNSNKSNHP